VTLPVGRLSRRIDAASLLLILAGSTLFLNAYLGMEEVKNTVDKPFERGTMEAFALTNRYLLLKKRSYIAIGLVGAGIVVGLSAAAHAHKIARRGTPDNQQPE
jgi:hypothetical protein